MKDSKLFLMIALVLISLFVVGCFGSDVDAPENDQEPVTGSEGTEKVIDNGDWSIVIDVVGEESVVFTNDDAESIGPTEITAAKKDKDEIGEEEIWTGIMLEDLLEYIGVKEFSVLSVEAADGSRREFDPERISEGATGIGWMVDGEMLDAENGPIQFIADQRGPKWWIKNVVRIEIIK